MKKTSYLLLLFIIAFGLTSGLGKATAATMAQVQKEAERGDYRLIATDELRDLINRNSGVLLVDTRQDWEYAAGHIEGAVNFPMEPTWLARLTKRGELEQFLGPEKQKHIVFYWAGLTWVRSDSAARVAVSLGYQNVYRDPLGFPEWQEKGFPTATSSILSEGKRSAQSTAAAGKMGGWTFFLTLAGIFLGGIALNLTPCVYPLIPITVSYFGGRSGQGRGTLLAHGVCYIAGLAMTNSVLGVAAAMTGSLMGSMLQNQWVLLAVAVVLLAFASSLFGFWELRLPGGLTRAASKSYTGYFGTFFMGITLGVVAAPCIGPFVIGLLTWIASTADPVFGFTVFFTLSLGLGLPLFILALFSGKLEKLPRSGEWMIWVRKLMGWVLVGMAAYFLRPLLPKTASILLYGAIALAAAIHLAWFDKSTAGFAAFKWIKTGVGLLCVGVALFLASSLLLEKPAVSWQPYSAAVMEQARDQNRPVILDFYATWCAPCRELDEITFHDPEVVSSSKQFLMIKVDLTTGDNPEYQNLVRDYKIKGVPTVVFLDRSGQERHDLRLVEFMKPDEFTVHMKKALSNGG